MRYSAPAFSQDRHVHVILHVDGEAHGALYELAKGNIAPSREIRRVPDDPVFHIGDAGGTDGHRLHLTPPHPNSLHHVTAECGDLLDDRARSGGRLPRRLLRMGEDLAIEVGQSDAYARPSDIGAEHVPEACIEAQ